MTLTRFIYNVMPDFCWQTAFEVLTMVECEKKWEDAESSTVYMAVMSLARRGKLLRREIKRDRERNGRKIVYQYKKPCA